MKHEACKPFFNLDDVMSSSANQILLPFELKEEIVSQIPVKYLLQFYTICKEWYSLFKNKRFTYKYLDLTQERFIRLHNIVQIIDPVAQTLINSPLMSAEFPSRPLIYTMLHCDGLVLLKFKDMELRCLRLLIWNPILGQIKWIQPASNRHQYIRNYYCYFSQYPEGCYVDTYGIGYDKVSREDHKILRFYNCVDNEIEIENYDLKSNSWKFLEETPQYWSLISSCKGVSVIGNMYWVARRWIDHQIFIQSFDFSTQTFKPRSCLPFQKKIHTPNSISLSCFRRDKLALLHQFEKTKKIEIWITNKVDEEVMSWSKYLSVADLPLLYTPPGFFIDKNDKIRIWGVDENEEESHDYNVTVYEISKRWDQKRRRKKSKIEFIW